MTVSINVEFDYDGKVRPARLDTSSINGRQSIVFTYKGVTVRKALDEDDIQEHVAENECKLIDKLGEEDYKILSKYRKRMNEIERSKIVVNNKVYNYHHDKIISGSHSHYTMKIKMQDGTTIYGDSPLKMLENENNKNQRKTFDNLVGNVRNHTRVTGFEPDELAIHEELTLEYMQMLLWIEKTIKN